MKMKVMILMLMLMLMFWRRKIMILRRRKMMMLRRRKMMMLRSRMLRRKTDPKTGKHTLCEPAQSKCRRTLHKSHFASKITGKVAADTSGDIVLCEPAQSKCTWTHYDTSQKPFCAVIYSENAGPISRDTRFVRACAIEMHMDITKAILHGSLQGKCRTRIPRHPFCASLPMQSKCTWTHHKSHFAR